MTPKKIPSFGGRIREKKQDLSLFDLVQLPHRRMAMIYQRLSTHEQVKKSIYSIAMQDALVQMAKEDGYPESMILVEKRDLGISGTLGKDERQGLAALIQSIEQDQLESVYVVHISRLFRDQTLIDGLSFGELCKRHSVVIVIPNMRLNLADKMHMRIYRMELERSADELELMKLRMGGARELKAKQGCYVSGSVPVGYIVNKDPSSTAYDRYVVYEPHAEIIRKVFQIVPEENFSLLRAAKRFERERMRIPFFPPQLEYMKGRSATRAMQKDQEGYVIRSKFIGRVLTNPAYIGWWIWGGTVLSKHNHSPIIDEEYFWYVQQQLEGSRPKGKTVFSEPLILQHLLYCTKHREPTQIHIQHDQTRYKCDNYYNIELDRHYCFTCTAKLLDGPITDFVVSQCSYPQYAEKIIKQLKQGYDEAKELAEANRRELSRLTAEIDKLKENLAYTKTQKQAEFVFQLIDERIKEREHFSQIKAYPAGRIGSVIQIEKVTQFLTDITAIWHSQPSRFKNEFLRIVLDKILITAERDTIRAKIIWKSGLQQEIRIFRPPEQTGGENRWAHEELDLLQENYATACWSDLLRALPNRGYFAILEQAERLQLKRNKGPWSRHSAWTCQEDELVRKVASGEIGLADVIERINRTPRAVYKRIKDLGLTYSKFTRRNGDIQCEVLNDGNGDQGQHPKMSSSPTRWFSPAHSSATSLRRICRTHWPSGAR